MARRGGRNISVGDNSDVHKKTVGAIILISAAAWLLAGCNRERPVSYSKDVRPILAAHCLECHHTGGQGQKASGFSMDSYESLMKGTRYGPMIIPGDAESSNVIVLMEGRADPSIAMPHGNRKPVPKKEIMIIRKWIDQGAKNN